MRSSRDLFFSNLCDRVGRGKINEEDEKYLNSRVQFTDSEKSNEKFKLGELSIIVTTNKKRNLINGQKLTELLPNGELYICNSVDRVKNLPGQPKVPEHFKDNPGKTGNLLTELNLKVGAPVVITTNHSKQKYREDGIVNGARGYVISIQHAKDDPEKVDIVWVVFNKEKIGKLYRFEHSHLKQNFNPGHNLATPILPQRKNFTVKFVNVEYQRTKFPLSLAYAITAHKCQGETLEEVIIDFGPDLIHKIRNYICPGSFYVALTRVRLGSKVFLKSFDKSYIQVNKSIEEKVEAMIKFRHYNFKKIYLDDQIFKFDKDEIKVGYLNINGLMDGGHAEYLDADFNLRSLDILVLAETKLDETVKNDQIEKLLKNWNLIGRYDSEDGIRHMGLMLLSSGKSDIRRQMKNITHQTAKRANNLQVQGMIVRLISGKNYGFIYCRSTPTNPEIKAICKYFQECNILMGDFNLSHRNPNDQEKIVKLCLQQKISHLHEITRSMSNNQLEYILVDEDMINICFVTSYNNFISDHKTIVARIGSDENVFTDEIREKILFDQESHLKARQAPSEYLSEGNSAPKENIGKRRKTDEDQEKDEHKFSRKFKNPDMATCWLNSCLQLLLTAIDYDDQITSVTYNSELGKQLLYLQSESKDKFLDPTAVKDILVNAEDIRIASRLSELSYGILNKNQLDNQSRQITNQRLDLQKGQQCVRDFFICLDVNMINWPDVYSTLAFELTHSTECSSCKHRIKSETMQLYLELPVPPNNSDLQEYVEDFLNNGSRIGSNCQEGCGGFQQKIKRTEVKNTDEAKFLTIILTRGVETLDGFSLKKNKIKATSSVNIR